MSDRPRGSQARLELVEGGRRWRVEREDGRRMDCHVGSHLDCFGSPVYEASVYFDGSVLYTQSYPTQGRAEREADNYLTELLQTGWAGVTSSVRSPAAMASQRRLG